MADGFGRRGFLIGSLTGAAALPVHAQTAAPAQAATPAPPEANPSGAGDWFFLTPAEAAFLGAAMERLIPADDASPSATDLGGVVFLDRQLATRWGQGLDWYMAGPWQAGTPEQGYQLRFTPAELYRRAIAALDRQLTDRVGSAFADLSAQDRDTVLGRLETAGTDGNAEVDLDGVPGATFFDRLLQDTQWSFLSDPAYGGNRDMASWRMLGFPGAHAYYNSTVDNWSMRYDRPPTGIATPMRPYGTRVPQPVLGPDGRERI